MENTCASSAHSTVSGWVVGHLRPSGEQIVDWVPQATWTCLPALLTKEMVHPACSFQVRSGFMLAQMQVQLVVQPHNLLYIRQVVVHPKQSAISCLQAVGLCLESLCCTRFIHATTERLQAEPNSL